MEKLINSKNILHGKNILIAFLLILHPLNPMQTSVAQQMTLKETIKYAFENNNELRAFKNSLSANENNIKVERSSLLPKLKFEEAYTNTNNPAQFLFFKANQERASLSDFEKLNDPGPINNFLTAIYFEQTILDRKANIKVDIAKTNYSTQYYDYLRKLEEIAFRVTQAYLGVDRDQELVNAAQKAVEDAKSNLGAAQFIYKNKSGYYSEILRANTALTEAEQRLISAQTNLAISKRALGLILGKVESVEIADIEIPETCLRAISYYNDNALSRNDIKSMELRYENAKNMVKLAESNYFPFIGINATYQLYDHRAPFALEGHNYLTSGFIRWDIFDGLKRRYEKAREQDKLAESCEMLNGFIKTVAFKVFEAYLNVEKTEKNLELSKSSLETASEGRNLVFNKYITTILPIVDLLNAQNNLNLARISLINDKYNYEIALINLSFESGIILQDLCISVDK